MPNETTFKEQVHKDLKKLPKTWFFKTAERGRHGIPDEVICMQGGFIAIELKRVGGETTKLQELTLQKIREAGGLAMVADPTTWPVQYAVLKEMALK